VALGFRVDAATTAAASALDTEGELLIVLLLEEEVKTEAEISGLETD
jgi:hypothetical protein